MQWFLHAATLLWAAILVVQIGAWSSVHSVPLRGTSRSISLPPDTRWRAVHVLVDDCACSRSVAAYLSQRGPQPEWREEVWVLGGRTAPVISHFATRSMEPDSAESAGITGGPRLLVFSPAGSLVWSGGYSPRKAWRAVEPADLYIMRAVSSGQRPEEIPVFGCPRPKSD